MSYNGWSNRETWLVNVWFNPVTEEDLAMAESVLTEQYESMPEGPLRDMIDLDAINWGELRESVQDSAA
jgi:hypothetical protein